MGSSVVVDHQPDIAALVREQAALGRTLRLRIASGSMAPLAEVGDEVVVAAAQVETLRPGSLIVAALPGGPFVVHRLMAIRREGEQVQVVTKGDRSAAPDPAWPAEAIVGQVVAIVHAGRTLDLTRGRGPVLATLQGFIARLEAAVYSALREPIYRLLGAHMPRLGWLARAPFRALAWLTCRMVR